MTKLTDAARRDVLNTLRDRYGVKAGSTLTTTVTHVSRSGMSRNIVVHVAYKGQVHDVSWLVAAATGMTFDLDRGGVKVGGCGMDMTFHLIYSLSRAMFPNGHKCNGISKGRHRCTSNDHSNDYGAAAHRVDAELEAEGAVAPSRYNDEAAYLQWFAERRKRIDALLEDGAEFGYRKGRKHADGGYTLTRSHG